MNKKNICLSILWTFFACTPSITLAQEQSPSTNKPTETSVPLNKIVAIVNDEIITQSELDTAMAQMQQDLTARNIKLPAGKTLREETLEGIINYRLQLQIANRAGVQPTEKEIDDAIALIAKSHNLTVEQLKQQLTLQNTNYEDFRKQIKEQYTVNKLQQQMVGGQVKVTNEDIEQFKKKYQNTPDNNNLQYHLVDFFLPINDHASSADLNRVLDEAHAIQNKLNHGEDIDTIQPPYRDLGWRTKNDLPQIFADQLSKLTTKNASQPLRAPNGYHVLKLVESKGTKPALPSDEEIRQFLYRQKYEIAVKEHLDKLRKEAYIQIISAKN